MAKASDETTPSPAPSASAISSDDLVRAIAGLSAEQRAALFSAVPTPANGPPKYSQALFSVPKAKYASVVEACNKGLEAARKPDTANDPEAQISPLRSVDPALAAAAQANSARRGKPLAHSLEVAKTWIREVGSKQP